MMVLVLSWGCNGRLFHVFARSHRHCSLACLSHLQGLLSPRGRLYMILVKENKPREIAAYCSDHGLTSEVI
jgi:hypothetical protein